MKVSSLFSFFKTYKIVAIKVIKLKKDSIVSPITVNMIAQI